MHKRPVRVACVVITSRLVKSLLLRCRNFAGASARLELRACTHAPLCKDICRGQPKSQHAVMNCRSLHHVWCSECLLQVLAIHSLLLLAILNRSAVRTCPSCSAGSADSSPSAAVIRNVHSLYGRVFLGCYGIFTAHSWDRDSDQAGFAAFCHRFILRCTPEHFPLCFQLQTVLCVTHGVGIWIIWCCSDADESSSFVFIHCMRRSFKPAPATDS